MVKENKTVTDRDSRPGNDTSIRARSCHDRDTCEGTASRCRRHRGQSPARRRPTTTAASGNTPFCRQNSNDVLLCAMYCKNITQSQCTWSITRAVNDIDLNSITTATRDVLAGNDSIQGYHNQPPFTIRSRVVNGAVRVVAVTVVGDVTGRLQQLPAAAGVVRVLQQHG